MKSRLKSQIKAKNQNRIDFIYSCKDDSINFHLVVGAKKLLSFYYVSNTINVVIFS